MKRLLREPLFHFLALGSLIFVVYEAMYREPPAPRNTIDISPARIEQLSKGFEAAWHHPPSSQELAGIVAETVREEVYYREALALGLDTNDTIVRRRLRQKMEFLTDSGAEVLAPGQGELEAYWLTNQVNFQEGARVSFEQVYLGQDTTQKIADQLLRMLQAQPDSDVSELGERSMLPARLDLVSDQHADSVFGSGFYGRIKDLPLGAWGGPIVSGFGAHLVRVTENVPPHTLPLVKIQDRVRRDWQLGKKKELREFEYERMLNNYVVKIHDATNKATRGE